MFLMRASRERSIGNKSATNDLRGDVFHSKSWPLLTWAPELVACELLFLLASNSQSPSAFSKSAPLYSVVYFLNCKWRKITILWQPTSSTGQLHDGAKGWLSLNWIQTPPELPYLVGVPNYSALLEPSMIGRRRPGNFQRVNYNTLHLFPFPISSVYLERNLIMTWNEAKIISGGSREEGEEEASSPSAATSTSSPSHSWALPRFRWLTMEGTAHWLVETFASCLIWDW